jgi:hypothetical protein
MYQVYCGMNTPPESVEEQERCLTSKTRCWRLAMMAQRAHDGMKSNEDEDSAPVIPLNSVTRRNPSA